MNETNETEEEDSSLDEDDLQCLTLEDISDELDDILFSMHDLGEKIALYQSQPHLTKEVHGILRKLAEFCSRHKELSGLLEEYL